jgi:hypothetical protein
MSRDALTSEERRSHAISKARERRRAGMTPLLEEIDDAITCVGWAGLVQ